VSLSAVQQSLSSFMPPEPEFNPLVRPQEKNRARDLTETLPMLFTAPIQESAALAIEQRKMSKLDTFFVFDDRRAIESFLKEQHVRGLLEDAVGPLTEAFGEKTRKILRVVHDDDNLATLFCFVQLGESVENARVQRGRFDREWWISNSRSAVGKLNFDFELV
jgi:hypothetical protein